MKNKWLFRLGVLLTFLLIVFFAAGYFLGNVPIASKLLGTNTPRDLGVEISTESAADGLAALRKPLTTSELEAIIKNPLIYTRVTGSLTNEQASSMLSLGDIPDFPVKFVQVKFGDGGQVEVSGVLDVAGLQEILEDYGVSGGIVDTVMGIVKTAKWVNVYAAGTLSISNNVVTSDLEKLEIGRISVPLGWVESNTDSILNGIGNSLTSEGYNIRSMTISQGKVNFDMDRPLASISPWLKFVTPE
ncbi:hypothetical protein [Dehalogenimonas sp. 4OHTPN]|uniref:DUF2993 domain-containing protein n=1 Tax=Dehalogenimonas sp. 4OHTPN TaxID=3166643 RepID=A0AAU8GBB0_9CHLR